MLQLKLDWRDVRRKRLLRTIEGSDPRLSWKQMQMKILNDVYIYIDALLKYLFVHNEVA